MNRATPPTPPTRGAGRFLLLLAGLAAVTLVGCAASRKPTDSFEPAPFTPKSPAVDELRAAVRGANLVICVIDAARPDHMGCHGYPRDTTPNIDRLAQNALLFDRHFCQFPHTKPSTSSLFTSKYPDTHLAYDDRALTPSAFTLTDGLRSAGFHTALFSGNPNVAPGCGVSLRFDRNYWWPLPEKSGGARAVWSPEPLIENISSWLEEGPPSPFFAYIHFMPPHFPYDAPKQMKDMFRNKPAPNAWSAGFPFPEIEPQLREKPCASATSWANVYDANLRYADWAVAQTEDLLRKAGVFDNTLFILTSDHGEGLSEHGYTLHERGVYDEMIRIPLLVKFPGDQGPVGRIGALTQTIDLFPTICDLFEIPYPRDQVQGRSLLPLMAGEAEKVNDYIFARAKGDPPSYLVRDTRSALVLYRGGKLRALYDLEKDPRQVNNVIQEQPHRAARLEEAFRRFAAAQVCKPFDFIDPRAKPGKIPRVPKVKLSKRAREELRALGYVE